MLRTALFTAALATATACDADALAVETADEFDCFIAASMDNILDICRAYEGQVACYSEECREAALESFKVPMDAYGCFDVDPGEIREAFFNCTATINFVAAAEAENPACAVIGAKYNCHESTGISEDDVDSALSIECKGAHLNGVCDVTCSDIEFESCATNSSYGDALFDNIDCITEAALTLSDDECQFYQEYVDCLSPTCCRDVLEVHMDMTPTGCSPTCPAIKEVTPIFAYQRCIAGLDFNAISADADQSCAFLEARAGCFEAHFNLLYLEGVSDGIGGALKTECEQLGDSCAVNCDNGAEDHPEEQVAAYEPFQTCLAEATQVEDGCTEIKDYLTCVESHGPSLTDDVFNDLKWFFTKACYKAEGTFTRSCDINCGKFHSQTELEVRGGNEDSGDNVEENYSGSSSLTAERVPYLICFLLFAF